LDGLGRVREEVADHVTQLDAALAAGGADARLERKEFGVKIVAYHGRLLLKIAGRAGSPRPHPLR
jgi:hypothetical protein